MMKNLLIVYFSLEKNALSNYLFTFLAPPQERCGVTFRLGFDLNDYYYISTPQVISKVSCLYILEEIRKTCLKGV